ncbi:Hypothetical predicted protein [Paramuricea clavata]|uniref:Uncharacterized protein n=1 Tax=Paramuricea clavata TaxID=317549 RepID=A0A7D9HX01_PARCT|nr:Hypothetical predicted protein [Paramuricea clavata]
MTFDELEELVKGLGKASKAPSHINYFEISESEDYLGNKYRLVLKDSEYLGLVVCKLKSCRAPDVFPDKIDEKGSPLPISDQIGSHIPAENVAWNECFDKFYINKNDDWLKIVRTLRSFCIDLNHIFNVDDESKIPDSKIEVIPATPSLLAPHESTNTSTPTPKSQSDDDEAEVSNSNYLIHLPPTLSKEFPEMGRTELAVKVLLSYMGRYGKSCEETVTCFYEDMNYRDEFDYCRLLEFGEILKTTSKKLLSTQNNKD